MDTDKLLAERIELYKNVYAHEHNHRVPFHLCGAFWMALDAGMKITEALSSQENMRLVNRHTCDTYVFDSLTTFGPLLSVETQKLIGGGNYKVDEKDESVYIEDFEKMLPEEYPLLRDDPLQFYWTKVCPRMVKKGFTMGELEQCVLSAMSAGAFMQSEPLVLQQEYGIIIPPALGMQAPIETLFSALRGMKGTAMDLRRRKAEVKETLDAMEKATNLPMLQMLPMMDGTGRTGDIMISMLAHSFLNTKQFEEFFWPYIKTMVDFCAEHGKTIYFFCEAEILRFADFFQDVPAKIGVVHIEQDDPLKIREKLPELAISGGFPVMMLGMGTKEDCVTKAKELIDSVGDGYIMSTDKMLTYKNDVNPENLLALGEFVRNYEI